jgi:U4/U6.U5 tri-snRNP component SNU23
MSDSKKGAYGGATGGGDTDFRRTWDREEWAKKAEERAAREREEGKARYEAKLAGKKYTRRASTPPDAAATQARERRLDVSSQIGKTMLVPATSAVGKKGRGAGIYCADCDLTFKDNLQFVEHLNSTQHLRNVNETGRVERAGQEQVAARLAWLWRKKIEAEREAKMGGAKVEERVKMAAEKEEQEREERRRKRNERRRKNKHPSTAGEG